MRATRARVQMQMWYAACFTLWNVKFTVESSCVSVKLNLHATIKPVFAAGFQQHGSIATATFSFQIWIDEFKFEVLNFNRRVEIPNISIFPNLDSHFQISKFWKFHELCELVLVVELCHHYAKQT